MYVNAEDTVKKAQEYMAECYRHVVDLDLSKFFDTVNHDYLMSQVEWTLEDKETDLCLSEKRNNDQ